MAEWELVIEGGPENSPILTLEREGEVYHIFARNRNFILVSQDSGQAVPVWFMEAVIELAAWIKRNPSGRPLSDFAEPPLIDLDA